MYAAHEAPGVMFGPVAILAVLRAGLGVVLGVRALFIQDNFLIGVFARFLSPVFTTATSGPIAVDLSTSVGGGRRHRRHGRLSGRGRACGAMWLQHNLDPAVSASDCRAPRRCLSYNKFYFDGYP